MKIFHNSQYLSKLRPFVLKNKENFLNFLIGINLDEDENGDIHLYPVYRCLRIFKLNEALLIEIPLFKKGLLVVLEKYHIKILLLSASNLEFTGNKNNIKTHTN